MHPLYPRDPQTNIIPRPLEQAQNNGGFVGVVEIREHGGYFHVIFGLPNDRDSPFIAITVAESDTRKVYDLKVLEDSRKGFYQKILGRFGRDKIEDRRTSGDRLELLVGDRWDRAGYYLEAKITPIRIDDMLVGSIGIRSWGRHRQRGPGWKVEIITSGGTRGKEIQCGID